MKKTKKQWKDLSTEPTSATLSELKAAADRLAEVLADVDEEELVVEFEKMRRCGN